MSKTIAVAAVQMIAQPAPTPHAWSAPRRWLLKRPAMERNSSCCRKCSTWATSTATKLFTRRAARRADGDLDEAVGGAAWRLPGWVAVAVGRSVFTMQCCSSRQRGASALTKTIRAWERRILESDGTSRSPTHDLASWVLLICWDAVHTQLWAPMPAMWTRW